MVKITIEHPILQLKNTVQKCCTAFFRQHGFNYFQYLRCYQDGSFSLLTNNTGLVEHFSQMPPNPLIFSSHTQEHESLHSYWFLWDEELPTFPVQFAKEKCNLHHGLTLVRRAKQYYDMIAVALPIRRPNIGSFYLNKRLAIEQFINVFDKEHHDLIRIVNKNRISLAKSYRDLNYKKICLPNGRLEVSGPYGDFHMTAQEMACLRLLCQGATDKQIAQILHISSRTVETYITRIKQRSGIAYRNDLVDLSIWCP